MIQMPRVCPSCSYEDDDPLTSLEPRCPMCNTDVQQAEAEAVLRREQALAEQQREERRMKQIKEEEAEWRKRRSTIEESNAKNFDPSFIGQAKRKSQTARSEALRREEEASKRRLLELEREDKEKSRLNEKPYSSTPPTYLHLPPVSTPTTPTASNPNTGAGCPAPSPALLQLLSSLPHTPLVVFLTGMSGVSVGRTSLRQQLQESMVLLQLDAYVTFQDGQPPPTSITPQRSIANTLVLSVYDICHEKSFDFSLQQCKRVVFPTVLVGNKADLEYWRKVPVQRVATAVSGLNRDTVSTESTSAESGRGARFPSEPSVEFIEVSSLTGLHLGHLVDAMLRLLLAPHFTPALVQQLADTSRDVTEEEQKVAAATKDPRLSVYVRMLEVGVAAEAVLLKMQTEGVRKHVLLRRFPRVEFVPQPDDSSRSSGDSDISSDVSYSDSDSSDESSDDENNWNNTISIPKPSRRRSKRRQDEIKESDFLITAVNSLKKTPEKSSGKKSEDVLVQLKGRIDSRRDKRGGGVREREKKGEEEDEVSLPVTQAPQPLKNKITSQKKKKGSRPQQQQQQRQQQHVTPLPPPAPPRPPAAPSPRLNNWSLPPNVPSSPSGGIPLPSISTQDDELDLLFGAVEDLKSLSSSVSKELEQQNQMLNSCHEEIDSPTLSISSSLSKRNDIFVDSDDKDNDGGGWNEEVEDEDFDQREFDRDDIDIDIDIDIDEEWDDDINHICSNMEGTSIENKLDEVKNIMHMNIDMAMERGEKLDLLRDKSANLHLQSAQFYKQAKKSHSANMVKCLCCCCVLCAHGAMFGVDTCKSCVRSGGRNLLKCTASLKQAIRNLFPKKSLMDNVLADTENAFQTLAKALTFLIGSNEKFRCLGTIYYFMFGVWHQLLAWILSYVLIVSSTVLMILPSFFTLLIVRTSTIEKESKSFGIRQETIRHEKKEQAALRWLRIVLRSLPMTLYLLILPYFLVYRIFPSRSPDQITYMLVGYLLGIIALQVLGSVRVYYSWKSRDSSPIPAAPVMYYIEPEKPSKSSLSSLTSCCRSSSKSFVALKDANVDSGNINNDNMIKQGEEKEVSSQIQKKTPVPIPPNTFKASAANVLVVLSLTLEFFQMATFSLQNNPLEEDGDSDSSQDSTIPDAPSAVPTMAPKDNFWGSQLFDSVYVKVAIDSDMTLAFMWASVALVGLLILIFANQFFMELKLYGSLLRRIEDKDEAKDSFFFSFTGAIVYGHGKPNNISKRMRLVVSILSDVLFLAISLQLLSVLACDTDSNADIATLRAKTSVVCWDGEGEHALLATLALMAYAFYVPLSIMITPMLLEGPSAEEQVESEKPKDDGVAFLKLYLMTINVVKSVMLLVAVLGPQSISALVVATSLSSLFLGGITIAWYSHSSTQQSGSAPYSSNIHPCNVAFINYWKAASYSTSVVSALVVVSFHALQNSPHDEFVSQKSLTEALLACWISIIVVYVTLYYRHYKRVKPHRQLVAELIAYPFQWRDMREAAAAENGTSVDVDGRLSWWRDDSELEQLRHIPGFVVSPWQQHVHKSTSTTELLLRIGVPVR